MFKEKLRLNYNKDKEEIKEEEEVQEEEQPVNTMDESILMRHAENFAKEFMTGNKREMLKKINSQKLAVCIFMKIKHQMGEAPAMAYMRSLLN